MLERIPLQPLHKNLSNEELTHSVSVLLNMYDNHGKHFQKRPGLIDLEIVDDETTEKPADKIDGAYYSTYDKTLYLVSDTKLFYIRKSAGLFYSKKVTEKNCLYSEIFTKGHKPIFQLIGNILYVANNKNIGIITLGGAPTIENMYDFSTNSPVACVGLTYLNKRLIAIDGKNSDVITWTEVNDYTNWPAENFATAEAEADKAVALGQSWGEISIFGANTIEGWGDDGFGLVPKVGAVAEVGISAPYSLVKIEQVWYFLDNFRNVVKYSPSQRIPEVISFPIAKTLQELADVEDARGSFININGLKFYVLTFYKENLTFVFNLITNAWHQWTFWNTSLFDDVDFIGLSYAYSPDWQLHLWGDRRPGHGNIYIMDTNTFTDNETPINCVVRSGHVFRDSHKPKICNEITLRIKRGNKEYSDSTANLAIRYFDDNTRWSNPRIISLGNVGDHELTVKVKRLGRYHSRMWEFSISGNTDFALIEVFEDYEETV